MIIGIVPIRGSNGFARVYRVSMGWVVLYLSLYVGGPPWPGFIAFVLRPVSWVGVVVVIQRSDTHSVLPLTIAPYSGPLVVLL